ncbi:uncharacterized protein GGS25DRAFT_444150 [Hypoxylon fragiforme]|uniref:uncharacterized protein n=1 Tax=Hypoxylon fragiforme TaxID=63214 RepID=UPI0020C63F13|nr:uncharacterized protein GGS25DRAFT_444150 [Hypoxylon fragiforme]KAI2603990.1 hypothetical protein GGS25DRAFT_444150 [Hypoxylon fragiforme]
MPRIRKPVKMSVSGQASRATFSYSPPTHVRVGVDFFVKIKAPANDHNGGFAAVTLVRVPLGGGETSGFNGSAALLEGNLVGNWKSEPGRSSSGRQYHSIEFNPVRVNSTGCFFLRVQIYSAPAHRDDGSAVVEHVRDLESDTFYVEP